MNDSVRGFLTPTSSSARIGEWNHFRAEIFMKLGRNFTRDSTADGHKSNVTHAAICVYVPLEQFDNFHPGERASSPSL